jgi:hypothetical protein
MDHVLTLARCASNRRAWLSRWTLVLGVAGFTNGLITLAVGALLEAPTPVEELVLTADVDPWATCTWLSVGSAHEGHTRVHVLNNGPHAAAIRVTWSTEYGVDCPPITDRLLLAAWASTDIGFNTPGLGAFVELVSSVPHLQASADLDPVDGTASEHRRAHLCLGT